MINLGIFIKFNTLHYIKVKKHQAPTYYSWIQKEWLSTDFSVTLKQDIIRFVVTCIHPTNDLLASDVVPRL